MESLSDRLKKYIEFSAHKKIRAFERHMGWGNSTVNNLKNEINTDKLFELKDKEPKLNLGWLVTGNGKMIAENYLDDPFAPRYTMLKEELRNEPKYLTVLGDAENKPDKRFEDLPIDQKLNILKSENELLKNKLTSYTRKSEISEEINRVYLKAIMAHLSVGEDLSEELGTLENELKKISSN